MKQVQAFIATNGIKKPDSQGDSRFTNSTKNLKSKAIYTIIETGYNKRAKLNVILCTHNSREQTMEAFGHAIWLSRNKNRNVFEIYSQCPNL